MTETTHAQKVVFLGKFDLKALNGVYAHLLASGRERACEQFAAAAREAGFEQHPDAPDHGRKILAERGLAWRRKPDGPHCPGRQAEP